MNDNTTRAWLTIDLKTATLIPAPLNHDRITAGLIGRRQQRAREWLGCGCRTCARNFDDYPTKIADPIRTCRDAAAKP